MSSEASSFDLLVQRLLKRCVAYIAALLQSHKEIICISQVVQLIKETQVWNK